jgi:hypothetical protein
LPTANKKIKVDRINFLINSDVRYYSSNNHLSSGFFAIACDPYTGAKETLEKVEVYSNSNFEN